ncbi:MAG: response regulator transcription factor [Elusimicrobia bacterium]|nr:response regulator transcription factor [Elusimicrobiota bacterium]
MKLTILIVEDDLDAGSSLEDILQEQEGYRVLRAIDGETALYLAKTELPSLILLDLGIPKIDGLEVCRRLKQEDPTKLIPIFMITGADEMDQVEKALMNGASSYITKPFDIPNLLKKIREILPKDSQSWMKPRK